MSDTLGICDRPTKFLILIIFAALLIVADVSAQAKTPKHRRKLQLPKDPEVEDDAMDTSKPEILDQQQQNAMNRQWHPQGMAHPLSPAYGGYRGPMKSIIQPEEATLSIELFPMYYIPVTRSTSFKLAFSSNVLRKREVTFETFYSKTRYINFNYHPTKIKLHLWNNVFWIKYKDHTIVDEFDVLRSLEYKTAELKNQSQTAADINTKQRNMVFLEPQRRYSFKPDNIKKVAETKGRVICKEEIRRVKGYELLKQLKKQRLKMQHAQISQQHAMMHQSAMAANQNRSRRLKQTKTTESTKERFIGDGHLVRKINENKMATSDGFSKKKITEEMEDGKRSMLLLYDKKYIREIIIVCRID